MKLTAFAAASLLAGGAFASVPNVVIKVGASTILEAESVANRNISQGSKFFYANNGTEL
jgi:hypothetical protein